MANGKELPALYCGILHGRSTGSYYEDVELLDVVKLIYGQHRHIFSCFLSDAHNVGFGEVSELALRLTHGLSLNVYSMRLVGFVNKFRVLPYDDLIEKLEKAFSALGKFQ